MSFVSERAKTGQIVMMKPLVVVDDLLDVHRTLLIHNIPTILVAHPWNSCSDENTQRIANLEQFISAFSCVSEKSDKYWRKYGMDY
jgi:uncharacterized circularly permuted ATP-grasp superfamily protein